MRKIYILIILLIFLSGIFIVLYSGLKSKDAFSENLIISLSNSLEKDLVAYFDPIRDEFIRTNKNFGSFSGEQMDEDSLCSFFIPALAGRNAIGSVLLYNSGGYAFNVYREKNSYVSSLEIQEQDQGALIWSRRGNDNSISSTWTELTVGQEARRKTLRYILDLISGDDESVVWTGAYQSNRLREPVITAAVDWYSELDSSKFVCAFEMPVRLIIRHLQSYSRYKNRRIFLAMESGQMIDIPASIPDSIQFLEDRYKEGGLGTIQDSILKDFTTSWLRLGGETDMTYYLQIGRDDWWIHIREFSSFDNIAAMGLALPEGSLKTGLLRRYSRPIIAVTLFLISLIIYLIASSKRKRLSKPSSGTGK